MNSSLELLDRDCAGRISKWTFNKKNIILPEIAIVINPKKMLVTPKELQEKFGTKLIITNAYLIKKSDLKNEILEQGLHKYLSFDGIIMNDSGAYQEMFGSKIIPYFKEQSGK